MDEKIDGLLYERTAISRKPEHLIKKELEKAHVDGELTPDLVFRSSYFLTLSGLRDEYTETECAFRSLVKRDITEFDNRVIVYTAVSTFVAV